uniref:Reverse transcriptase domain-containing protein n=1 Tax=Callorhinchus milii TaxID=7868 RepID=A0A4W3J4I1_CALMI
KPSVSPPQLQKEAQPQSGDRPFADLREPSPDLSEQEWFPGGHSQGRDAFPERGFGERRSAVPALREGERCRTAPSLFLDALSLDSLSEASGSASDSCSLEREKFTTGTYEALNEICVAKDVSRFDKEDACKANLQRYKIGPLSHAINTSYCSEQRLTGITISKGISFFRLFLRSFVCLFVCLFFLSFYLPLFFLSSVLGISGSFSDWRDVTSGVPQGSVLGPQLFTIYINDLDEDIELKISKFEDDTKLGGRVSSEDDTKRLQRDIDRQGEWARRWQMEYNVGKCEVIHQGSKNRKTDYFLEGERLDSVSVQRDLGVLAHQSQKVSMQVQQATRKANGILAFIAKGLEYKSREVLLQVYKALVRPHLEYYVQFWSPCLRKDILALEGVQHRFTRLVPGIRGLTHEDRLNKLGLYSLEYRRIRGDLTETYKILMGLDRVDSVRLFPLVGESITRGHSLKMKGQLF